MLRYLDIREMAERLRVPRHRVVWVLRSRAIPPAVTVGEHHGYNDEQVNEVGRELAEITSRRGSSW